MKKTYELSLTTQGPAYPPSEVMDDAGNFVVIGYINETGRERNIRKRWGAALVSAKSELPEFGNMAPYQVLRELDLESIASGTEKDIVLHTLPIPLVCNNYPMQFAPQQCRIIRTESASQALHLAAIPDERPEDGRRRRAPVTLSQWAQAKGQLTITASENSKEVVFEFECTGLIPESLYTVMALRERDLDPDGPTRPGPLGLPNVFITDETGKGSYRAVMPNPVAVNGRLNRIINVVVLWMSTQMSYGGAIGYYGLGGDVHAQLKLKTTSFLDFCTEKENK